MEEQRVPRVLNWVKARAECSIDQLFIVLAAVVESDTKAADDRSGDDLEFKIKRVTTECFMVARTFNAGGILESEVIAFERKRDHIAISRRTVNGATELFLATPHVDISGECKFEVNGIPMEPWQVSKKALETFFFELF